MKKIILSTLLIFVSIVSYAQNWNSWSNWGEPENTVKYKASYEGEINVSYAIGTGSDRYNRYGFEFINGVRLNPNVFIGIGTGVYGFYGGDSYYTYLSTNYNGSTFYPIFADFKFSFLNKRVSPHLKIDVGYGIGANGRLYACPSLGMKCTVAPKVTLNFDLGFQIQQVNENGGTDTLGGILFKLGWSF